ncbi:adenine deaminase [Parasponia andersonii]|uniref:Adenine deaminase n=1 Tax=Parasponia andersonii TaxID=3476 RepID=A0A2P5BFX0_PARAD|nr:adenine deaminase [Parasponia andersonii]
MASNPSEEENPFVQGIMDGSCNLPVRYSSFKILKSSFDEVNHDCSLGMLPFLVEEASLSGSLKYPLDGSHAQDLYSISVLPQENNSLQCASQLAFLRLLKVPNPAKVCKEAQLNCQNCTDLQVNGAQPYSSCIVDIDVEKKSFQVTEPNEKPLESSNSESILLHLQRVLWKQASVTIGAKLIQLLMNYGTSRDKTGVERVHETPNNRWRRYKRAASIDSRKIVLLFSILSSLGTLILIYLTLRVRQSAEGIIRV